MPYVYSTATNDIIYADYIPSVDGGPNIIKRQVLIKGGANLATKHLVTPLGVSTQVSDDDLEFLEANALFQQHKKNGFMKITKQEMKTEKAIADMNAKDRCAPITPNDPKPNTEMKIGVGKNIEFSNEVKAA